MSKNKPLSTKPSWNDFRRWLDPSFKEKKPKSGPPRKTPGLSSKPIIDDLSCVWVRRPDLDCFNDLAYITGCEKIVSRLQINPPGKRAKCPYCNKGIIVRERNNV